MYLCSPFPLNGNERILHIDHDPYYRDRLTVRDLCYDFPEDEMYIDGLHAMQSHFYTHNVPVEIPIVRVMNAAHFLHAYVFQTTCSGDQMEYDALAYGSVGHDKKVMLVTLIVLAAMLKRTEGFRARQCRDVLLEDRSEDFYDGVSLYDQFLSSSEKHFAEEDFLLDTHNQIARQQEEIARLISENLQLKHNITTMEEKYKQVNIGTQNINFGTINNIYGDSQAPAGGVPGKQEESPSAPQVDLFRFIHPSVTDEAERVKVHREVENLVRTFPLPEICRYLMDMRKNCRVYLSVKPELMFDELHRMGMPDESTPGYSMKNFRSYFNVND